MKLAILGATIRPFVVFVIFGFCVGGGLTEWNKSAGKRISSNSAVVDPAKRPRDMYSFGIGKRDNYGDGVDSRLDKSLDDDGRFINLEDGGFLLEEDNNMANVGDEQKLQFPETNNFMETARNKRSDWLYSFALKRQTPYTFGLGKRNEKNVNLGKEINDIRDLGQKHHSYVFGLGK